VHIKPEAALVVLANFGDQLEAITVALDWESLGLAVAPTRASDGLTGEALDFRDGVLRTAVEARTFRLVLCAGR